MNDTLLLMKLIKNGDLQLGESGANDFPIFANISSLLKSKNDDRVPVYQVTWLDPNGEETADSQAMFDAAPIYFLYYEKYNNVLFFSTGTYYPGPGGVEYFKITLLDKDGVPIGNAISNEPAITTRKYIPAGDAVSSYTYSFILPRNVSFDDICAVNLEYKQSPFAG